MTREKSMEASYRGCFWSFVAVAILFALLLFSSCKSVEYVTVEKVRTDTTYITKWQRDSVWMHDSIHVEARNDTVRIEKWHTKYVEKQVHDTTYVATHDTIPVPFPQTEYVEKELTWWQRMRMNAGGIAIGLLAICIGYGIFRFVKRL
jgi:hypothetical protein